MNEPSSQLPEDFDQRVRMIQIISLALIMGVVFFAGVQFQSFQSVPPEGYELDMDKLKGFRLALIMFAFITIPMSFIIPMAFMKLKPAAHPGVWLNNFQAAHIIRLAMLEGLAFFGLVSIGGNGPELKAEPIYYLYALPALFMILVAVATFPTPNKLKRKIYEHFESNYKKG